MTKAHPLKGRKLSPEQLAKRKATREANAKAKANGHAAPPDHNSKDALVYLRHALQKWPHEKNRGISRLYVELAVATLEGKS